MALAPLACFARSLPALLSAMLLRTAHHAGAVPSKVFRVVRKAPLPGVLMRVCAVPQIFCLHGGLSPTLDTLDHIRALDRVQEVRQLARTYCVFVFVSWRCFRFEVKSRPAALVQSCPRQAGND